MLVNDDPVVVVDNDVQQIHSYELLFDDINNVDINFLNKEDFDTKVDHEGKIVEDMFIIVEKISIDHIDLTNKLHKISVYKDHTGKVHRSFNYIAFRGNFKIKIHKNLLYTDWLAGYL